MRAQRVFIRSLSGIFFVGIAAAGCTTVQNPPKPQVRPTSPAPRPNPVGGAKVTYNYTAEDRECLKRVMYFESEHSDHDGYMAVGTVVMNRLTSQAYSDSLCGVITQEKQFAPGLMTKEVASSAEPDLDAAADSILRGERHPGVKDAMFFHTEGLRFKYNNMHYVAIAGGNAFYEKRGLDGLLQTPAPLPAYEVAMNYIPSQNVYSSQFDVMLPATGPVPQLVPQPQPIAMPMENPAVTATAVMAVPLPTARPATMEYNPVNAMVLGGG